MAYVRVYDMIYPATPTIYDEHEETAEVLFAMPGGRYQRELPGSPEAPDQPADEVDSDNPEEDTTVEEVQESESISDSPSEQDPDLNPSPEVLATET